MSETCAWEEQVSHKCAFTDHKVIKSVQSTLLMNKKINAQNELIQCESPKKSEPVMIWDKSLEDTKEVKFHIHNQQLEIIKQPMLTGKKATKDEQILKGCKTNPKKQKVNK